MRIPLFNREMWRETFQTLSRSGSRTFLTAFGIFWGTAMLALLLGGATGLTGMIGRQFAGISTNIGGFASDRTTMSYGGFNKGTRWTLTETDVENVRRTAPYIDKMTSLNWSYGTAIAGSQSKSATFIGVEPQYFEMMTMDVKGRTINSADLSGNRKVAMIGTNIASRLFPDEDPVGKHVMLSGIDFMIVGVATQHGEATIGGRVDDSFLIPSTTMRRAFALGNKVDFVAFVSPDGHKPSENKAAILRVLRTTHPIHPEDENAVYFQDFSEIFEMVSNIFLGVKLLALFVGLGSLLAGVIGVGNIMWIIVKERTPEFGVRRAIGARPIDITAQVLCESVLLTVTSGIAGVCFAAGILALVDHLTFDPILGNAGFELPFRTALWIVLIFIFLGTAAGTLPAIKAMRIKPIEAIRDK